MAVKKQTPQQEWYHRLQMIRENTGYAPNAFGESIMEMNRGQYRRTETGEVGLTTAKLQVLAEKTGVNLHWLITGQGDMYFHNAGNLLPQVRVLVQDYLNTLKNATAADTQQATIILSAVEEATNKTKTPR